MYIFITRLIGDSDMYFIQYSYTINFYYSSHRILVCMYLFKNINSYLNNNELLSLPPFLCYYTPPWRALVIVLIHTYV